MIAMATGTAPTEDEIRQALEQNLEHLFGGNGFSIDDPATWEVLAPIMDSDQARVGTGWDPSFTPPDDHPGTLWADMRPSEVDELEGPIGEIVAEAEAAFIRAVLDGVVAHAARFAAAHPDIPRGAWRPARD